MGDDRPAVYVEDSGLVVYRASAVGYCMEALLALRQGFTGELPPEWFREKLDEGTAAEEELVQAAVQHIGGELVSTQEEVIVPVIQGQVVVRGHTDGRIETMHGIVNFGVEAKKLGPSLWEYWEQGLDAFFKKCPYYADQLTIYMRGANMPFVFVGGQWDPEEKKVIKTEVREIDQAPSDLNEIRARILQVEARFADGEMPECDGGKMWPCPVYFIHEEKREEVGGGTGAELLACAEEYEEARTAEKEAKKKKDIAAGKLFELMKDRPDSVTVGEGEYILTKYEHVSTKQDTPRLNEALREIGLTVKDFQSQTKTPKVRVTRKGS